MERLAVTVRGIVQGVGFRPHAYRLAVESQLTGFVQNDAGAVRIEVEGDRASLDVFCANLVSRAPCLSAIEHVQVQHLPCCGDRDFRVVHSADRDDSDFADLRISPDVATCNECLAELFDPANRRHKYPFINCTHCGPRLTIIRGAPYDRERTTMAGFVLCPQCRAEYENPADRRFHAQPTCCPHCGPQLRLLSAGGEQVESTNPLADFAAAVRAGQIGALKGLGGYHLVCDATSEQVVAELRRRKQRDDKPFALMLADGEEASRLCDLGTEERRLLESAARPIVLLRRRHGAEDDVAPSVAPRNPNLGVMLPYTPLHHLLVRELSGVPLVMTSGNRSDEPIAYRDEAAPAQLAGIADVLLTHNRAIHVRCDDSVIKVVGGIEAPMRRSRGYAPRPIDLPHSCPKRILAVGGQLKNTFALGRTRTAILSHHLGDLDHFEAYRAFEHDIALYEELFEIRPQLLVHDLHSDYASTRYARERVERDGMPAIAVQHHHAHIASCMAEHGLDGPVIGVAFDGAGLGTDGTIWGGEFLIADYRGFQRAAHLRAVSLPGGDRAIREPWRAALAHLDDADCAAAPIEGAVHAATLRVVRQMLARRVNCPLTSSAGRLFDAVAAIAGIRTTTTFEGQAAIELEWLAASESECGSYPFEIVEHPAAPAASSARAGFAAYRRREIDCRPLLRAIANDVGRGESPTRIARRFQSTLVDVIVATCELLRRETRLDRVALSGGVFLNQLLLRESAARLEAAEIRVYRHQLVPTNDGGLSFGQLAIAAAQINAPIPQVD